MARELFAWGNKLRVALVLLGVLMALVVPVGPAQAFDDSDGDGLDDGLLAPAW